MSAAAKRTRAKAPKSPPGTHVPPTAEERTKLFAKSVIEDCAKIRPQLDDLVDYGRHDQHAEAAELLAEILMRIRSLEIDAEEEVNR